MARNFYFGSDASMATGSAAFSKLINENAASLGLTEAQALEYRAVDEELQDAMAEATRPSTRTSVSVQRKNAAVKAMQRRAVALANTIRSQSTVDDSQLLGLGLLRRTQYGRRSVPTTPPRVRVMSVVGRVVTLRVCDAEAGTGKSKPFGAIGAELFTHVGEESPATAQAYHYERVTSRTTATITFPNDVPSGATVWISATWISARGERSLGSAPISFTLQGGAITAAADGLRLAA